MCVYHNVILFSQEKEENPVICSMDGTWGHYAKWDKSGIESQILHDVTYMWNLLKKVKHNFKIKSKMQIWPLFGEIRSLMPPGTAKK